MTTRTELSAYSMMIHYTTYTYNDDDLLIEKCDYHSVNYRTVPYRYTFYEYDDYNRMTGYAEINASSEPSFITIAAHKMTYTYDIEDKLTEIRYPQADNDKLKGVRFEYNGYKWLTKIKGIVSVNNVEVNRDIREYEYYNNSTIKTIKDYRGFLAGTGGFIKKDYTYDAFDRVTGMQFADSSNLNVVLESHAYTYDKNSNILTETYINNYPQTQSEKVNEIRTYTYDNLNRLKTSKITNNTNNTEKNTSYTYDKVGNCTQIVEDGVTTTNTYNAFNQLTQSTVTNGNTTIEQTTYSYNAQGCQTSSQTRNGSSVLTGKTFKTYDASNRMTSMTGMDGNSNILYEQDNTYTTDGKRVSRTDDGDETHFFYQGDVLVYTTDENGDKLCQNIIGPENNIIATIHYDNGQHAYFYNKDIRTSVTNIVDESGNGVVVTDTMIMETRRSMEMQDSITKSVIHQVFMMKQQDCII